MKKSNRGRKQPVRLSSLFNKALPENFRSRGAEIQHYQAFFESRSGDAVFQMVRVMNVTEDTLSLSVPSPALVNYLRLHTQEIRQQITEQFGKQLELKIVASPDSGSEESSSIKLKPARHFDQQVCDRLQRSAAGVDDDNLRQALIALSKSIRKKS